MCFTICIILYVLYYICYTILYVCVILNMYLYLSAVNHTMVTIVSL